MSEGVCAGPCLLAAVSAAAVAAFALSAPASAGDPCPPEHLTGGAGIYESFGFALAVKGDVAVIGTNPIICCSPGAVYVFHRRGAIWSQVQVLAPPDGVAGDAFGFDVALDGHCAIVSTTQHLHPGAPGSGAAYVFRDTGSGWIVEQELLASTGFGGDYFGRSVALSGNVAIVGAFGDDNQGSAAGAAYIYRFNGSTWLEEQKLTAADGRETDFFGWSVAIHGDTALVGTPNDYAGPEYWVGSAYVFKYDGSRWVQQQKLTADNGAAGDQFGYSVALSGTDDGGIVALIGAVNDVGPPGFGGGSAYVFRPDPRSGSWYQEQKLVPAPGAGGYFGRSVSIDGDWVVIGADTSGLAALQHGAAFVYHYHGGQWNLAQTMLPVVTGLWFPFFGKDVAISGSTALIGAAGEMQQAGSVYVYNVNPVFADLNCDGAVNGIDLAMLLGWWGRVRATPSDTSAADLNHDGVVNGIDLGILLAAWMP